MSNEYIELLTKISLLDKAIQRKLDLIPEDKKNEILSKFIKLLEDFNDILDKAIEGE